MEILLGLNLKSAICCLKVNETRPLMVVAERYHVLVVKMGIRCVLCSKLSMETDSLLGLLGLQVCTEPTTYLAQGQSIGSDLLDQILFLGWGGKIDAALQHAAAVAVGCDLHGIGSGRIVHKLAFLGSEPLEATLDDMIAIQVPDEGHHTRPKGFYDQLHLQQHLIKMRSDRWQSGLINSLLCILCRASTAQQWNVFQHGKSFSRSSNGMIKDNGCCLSRMDKDRSSNIAEKDRKKLRKGL